MKYTGKILAIQGKKVKQVNKTLAKKHFDKGETIFLNACNMRINNSWSSPMPINNENEKKFDTVVNEFEYYNCCNERGKYANFFIELTN